MLTSVLPLKLEIVTRRAFEMSQYVSPFASVLLLLDELLLLFEALLVLTRFERPPASESLATKPPSDWYSLERFFDLEDMFLFLFV